MIKRLLEQDALYMCSSERRRATAFTLLELIVVIGVIAVLLSIAVPALRSAKSSALSAKCRANLATIGRAFEMYTYEHSGRLPTYDFKRDPDGVIRAMLSLGPWGAPYIPSASGALAFPTDHVLYWSYALRTYLSDESESAPFRAVEVITCPVVFSEITADNFDQGRIAGIDSGAASYLESPALFTSIPPWTSPGGVDINRDYAAVAMSSVESPSNKSLLVERHSFHSGHEVPLWADAAGPQQFNVLAVDGHVERRRADENNEPVSVTASRFGGLPCGWCETPTPMLTTARGAAGRDW